MNKVLTDDLEAASELQLKKILIVMAWIHITSKTFLTHHFFFSSLLPSTLYIHRCYIHDQDTWIKVAKENKSEINEYVALYMYGMTIPDYPNYKTCLSDLIHFMWLYVVFDAFSDNLQCNYH